MTRSTTMNNKTLTVAWCPNCDNGHYVESLVGEKCGTCSGQYKAVVFERQHQTLRSKIKSKIDEWQIRTLPPNAGSFREAADQLEEIIDNE